MFLPQQKHVVFVLLRNGDNYSVPNAFQPMTEQSTIRFLTPSMQA